jgi:hypothetical protein
VARPKAESQSDQRREVGLRQFRRFHFGLGFIDLCNDQLGLGHRAPHKIMDAHVAWDFISLLCVFRSKLAHFCPIMNKGDSALIW